MEKCKTKSIQADLVIFRYSGIFRIHLGIFYSGVFRIVPTLAYSEPRYRTLAYSNQRHIHNFVIFETLVYSEPEACSIPEEYSESCQTSTTERFANGYTVDSRYNEPRGEMENSSLYLELYISKNLRIFF